MQMWNDIKITDLGSENIMRLSLTKIKLLEIMGYNYTSSKIISKNLYNKLNTKKVNSTLYRFVLITLLLITLFFIEYNHPYFFLQDDNRDYFLPYFIYNYKSLLKGEVAIYNFHQFLGTPSLAIGQSATLYPITYLAVFLSSLFFGHYFAGVDIIVILHLLIGAVGFYEFIRFFGIDWKIAIFSGLTWPLSSFIIYVSNSWVIVSAVAAYFPWMLLLGLQLYKTPTLKIVIYSTIVKLLFFYTGAIQYFIYSVIFEFISVILFIRLDSKTDEKKINIIKFFKNYTKELVYVFIFSLPLLLPMWHQTSISAQRSSALPIYEFVSQYLPMSQLFKDLLYPFGLAVKHKPWLFENENLFGFSHIGYLTVTFLIIGTIEKVIIKPKRKKIGLIKLSMFIIPALIAFLWATSLEFNVLIYSIPILNRFRWPFKLTLYVDFYLIVISSLMLSNSIKRFSWKKGSKIILIVFIIAIQLFNFIFIYINSPYKTFRYHGDNLPIKEELEDKLVGGRIISIGFDEIQNDFTAPSLSFNYATLFGLDYFAGYEPLISSANSNACLGLNYIATIRSDNPIPVDYLRKAAVKWYIVPKDKVYKYLKNLSTYGIVKRYEDDNRIIFYDEKAYPMIFDSKGEKIESQYYRFTTNTIEVDINNEQVNNIIFNNIYNPFFEGFVDGKKTKLIPINDVHFSISVPEGNHHITIKYRDPYLIVGIYIAIISLIVFVIRYILSRKSMHS